MSVQTSRRPSVSARRAGYVTGALVGAAGLFVINIWPGWDAVPFLTAETTEVLWLVNVTLLVGIVANLIYLFYDAPWLTSLGGVVTTIIGLVAAIRITQVFPFDFGDWAFDATVLAWILLIIAIVGSAIGIVVQVVSFVRAVSHGT